MADWKPAPSVAALLKEATARWPNRNRASDGTIGDTAHQAHPTSDHNPDSRGIVHAADLTHDPAHGVDCDKLAALLVTRKDPRVRYIIWEGRICKGPWSDSVLQRRTRPWAWEPYRGVNPHNKHMHVSVGYAAVAENDVSPWWVSRAPDKEGTFMGVEFKDKGELAEFIAKTVYGPGSETPRVAGTVNAKQVVETAATAARAAKESADKATAAVAALTRLFEAHVLKQGGSPTGDIP